MNPRNTGLLLVATLLLGGFVYFYEIRGRAEREEEERQAELLVHFETEQVTGLEVETDEGTVRATRSDGEWSIVAPLAVPADGSAIDALVDRLQGATHERMVVEAAEDMAHTGLRSRTPA